MEPYRICSWIVANVSAREAIECLAASGFTEVELSDSKSPLVQAWEKDPVGIREKLASAGIEVSSIHSPIPGWPLDAADKAARQASIQANLQYFGWMKECGIEEIVVHATRAGALATEEERAASRARGMESLRVLADRAKQEDIRIAVENIGGTMAELLQVIEGQGDHVGLCLDVGHAEAARLDLLHELKTAISAGKLFSLHLHDVSAEGKDHFLPGEGRINYDAFISELDASGFQGGRTLEIAPPKADLVGRLREAAALKDEWASRK